MMQRSCLLFAVLMMTLRVMSGQPAPSPVPARDAIWSGVVLATNIETPTAPNEELAPIEEKLKSVFGYNHYELIGSHLELMDEPNERWLIPSKVFCLRANSKHGKGKTYLLNLQLFQRTKMLAEFDAKVTAQSPLVIRGPLCGKGQLLFVLRVQ